MARKQFLQNVHTTKKYSPEVIAAAQLKDGEIAVFQNTEEPSLAIKVGETYAQFKDSSAVTKEITLVKEDLQGKIEAITGDSGALKNYLKSEDADKKFETKADASTKKTEAISSAKNYTDAEITKLTGDTDGSLQKQITANKTAIKGNSDNITELSAGTTAYTTTAVSEAKKELIGTTTDTKDTKTIEGTRKYAESLAAEITGSTVGSIGARLKAVEDKATANASNISKNAGNITALEGTDADTSASKSIAGAKKYADEKIATAVSSVYKVKGTCTYDKLPESGNANGDVWNVTDAHGNVPAGTNYVWLASEDGGSWDALAGTVDLSPYLKKADFEALQETVKEITGTTLNGYVKTGATSDQKGEMTGYGLRAYADDAVSTAKATLEGNSDSTSATTTIEGAKKFATQSVAELKKEVNNNATGVSNNKTEIANLKTSVDTAVQTITVTNTETNKITATKTGTNYTFNFDNMVIDCGEF